jgi:RNA polymerase sigma-70 factor (ECF subfamily)
MATPTHESTCWTVIRGAAEGDPASRERFACTYGQVLRAYLAVRWRHSPCRQELEDAVQEIFLACFRPDGVLQRADPSRAGGFRPYLYGVAHHVAQRVEERQRRNAVEQPPAEVDLEGVADEQGDLGRVFDRAWAQALLQEAAARQFEQAQACGAEAQQRVELLRLRFHEGLPIREIARRWQADPGVLHHQYARARKEFLAALREVMAFHQPGSPEEIEQGCAELLTLLG